ncbi:hypothetical protein [Actinomadura opuntiae]|uniref:hypothetical protein n=1 Tax=Actinomadura sp. OS1-43 TaxID=604315 RepID=UPI00255AEB9D|nr:hypothetical protein [Actinomadura sp. OS1-43]MDL4821154.1 hypothetical protein [Actinomadura sp. OS1-43]
MPEASAGGVSDDWATVARHVDAALRGLPGGARGVVRRVRVSLVGRGGYVDLGEVAEASRLDGGVVWTAR